MRIFLFGNHKLMLSVPLGTNIFVEQSILFVPPRRGGIFVSIICLTIFNSISCQLRKPETAHYVIVHQTKGLHVCIHSGAANKLKAALL
jgi:hypothetical protein